MSRAHYAISFLAILPIAILAAVTVTVIIDNSEYGQEMREFAEKSNSWCEEHGGQLHQANTVGKHGGLHCQLEHGGESVHMASVAALNWTDDVDAAQKHFKQRPGPFQPKSLASLLILLLIVVGVLHFLSPGTDQ